MGCDIHSFICGTKERQRRMGKLQRLQSIQLAVIFRVRLPGRCPELQQNNSDLGAEGIADRRLQDDQGHVRSGWK